MDILQTLKDIGERSSGEVFLGVVGPVRVGKSTFIKKFIECVVLDNIPSSEDKKRTIDELPQSGEGKTIMTMEPKFIPSNAVKLKIDDSLSVKIRLIDSVGFIIESSSGYLEDGKMHMIKTPWFNEPIPFDEAAKIGTKKVIKDHSTLGIVVVSDGTPTGFDRSAYLNAEERVIKEVIDASKPFVIVLNSKMPSSNEALQIKKDLEEKYNVPVINLDVDRMSKEDGALILKEALYEYPISSINICLPKWVNELDNSHYIKKSIKDSVIFAFEEVTKVKDVNKILDSFKDNEFIEQVKITSVDTGSGMITLKISILPSLYEKVIEELCGCKIANKSELIKVLTEFTKAKRDYDVIGGALQQANLTGYGFSSSSIKSMKIEEPTISKVSSRYALKVKASTPTYHIIKVDVGTTFESVLGSKEQADYFLDYLLKAYQKDELSLLNCEMFGRKFFDIFQESISSKLNNLPEGVKLKLIQLIKTISNKGKGNLIAFVF